MVRGWSPGYVASVLEIPCAWYDRYEAGDLMPPTYTLYMLAGLFGVGVGKLVVGEELAEAGAEDVFDRLLSLPEPDRDALFDVFRLMVSTLECLRKAS
jgi:transcriptional regulator with XRE-family HTH domain